MLTFQQLYSPRTQCYPILPRNTMPREGDTLYTPRWCFLACITIYILSTLLHFRHLSIDTTMLSAPFAFHSFCNHRCIIARRRATHCDMVRSTSVCIDLEVYIYISPVCCLAFCLHFTEPLRFVPLVKTQIRWATHCDVPGIYIHTWSVWCYIHTV